MAAKVCTKCSTKKPPDMFFRDARKRDGRAARCKNCAKGGRYGGRIAAAKQRRALGQQGQRRCSACKEVKARTAFGVDRHRPDGINVYCKMCVAEAHRTTA